MLAALSPFPSDAGAQAPAKPGHLEIVDLGTLPGGASSEAWAVNDRGAAVGWSDAGNGLPHAFMWRNGQMIDLGSLDGPSGWSYANDVNDRGEVVGTSSAGSEEGHAFSGVTVG